MEMFASLLCLLNRPPIISHVFPLEFQISNMPQTDCQGMKNNMNSDIFFFPVAVTKIVHILPPNREAQGLHLLWSEGTRLIRLEDESQIDDLRGSDP